MSSSPSKIERSRILVCGCGVIGLTTSIRLLEAGYAVTIIAAHLPGDPLTPEYCSTAAGAHHLSFAADDDERQKKLDKRTFEVMWSEEESEGGESALLKVVQKEFYGSPAEKHLAFFETLPDFRIWEAHELPPYAKHAVSFTSLTMDTSAYLNKLMKRLNSLGGVVYRAAFTSLAAALDTALSLATNGAAVSDADSKVLPAAIINCTGLGSLHLKDVQDKAMHPVRGQVVVLRAPWIKEGRTFQVSGEGGERTYIIPRRSGEVVIGGTREEGDWTSMPRPETSRDIKRRALAICPELIPLSQDVSRPGEQHFAPEELDPIFVRDVVGFRPARKGGLRLERGDDMAVGVDRKIAVFHNIGHSGAGWQSSWGCAEVVVELVSQAGI